MIAGLTAVCGVLGLGGFVGGIMIMQNNMGAGGALLCLGVCTIFPAMLGFVVAELMGLISQMRMATGLRDRAFGNASKLLLVVAILLTLLSIIAVFVMFLIVAADVNKAQQQQFQQQQQQNNNDKNKEQPAGNAKQNDNQKQPLDKPKEKGQGKVGPVR